MQGPADGDPHVGFDALLDCALEATGCSGAGVSLTSGRDWFRGPSDDAALQRAALGALAGPAGAGLLEVSDCRADARFASHPQVCGGPRWRFLAALALERDGAVVGTLCVLDAEPRRLNDAQRCALAGLAAAALALEQARARLLLLDAERARLHDFARASSDWLWECDAALRYTWIAGAFEALTGEPAGALIGQRLADAPLLDIDGVPLPAGGGLLALFAQGSPFARALCEEATPRGRLVVSRSAVPWFDANGRLCGWRGSARDVSRRIAQARAAQAADERLRRMLALLPGVVYQYREEADGRRHFPWFNPRAAELFGIDVQAWNGDADVLFCRLDPQDRARMRETLLAARTALDPWKFEYRYEHPAKGWRWFESLAVPERLADGATLWHGFTHDTSERKQFEAAVQDAEKLQRDKREAELAYRAKSELLSRVSHELRTPLNGILGFAQLMALDREAPLAEPQRQRLHSVQRAGRHLLQLVNDVLDLTRIDRGELALDERVVDLTRALEIGLVLVRPLATLHAVELPAHGPPAPCWVRADARALEQVLINLLSNAIQYNRPQGRVRVTLDEGAAFAAIAVHDEGPGLSDAQQRRLFQPFNRFGAEPRSQRGSGLGLAIAQQLTQAMRGTLGVVSRPGAGSCFTLTLPRAHVAHVPADSPAPLGTPPPEAAAAPPTAYRVLYIEDEPLNALLMEEVFRAHSNWQLEVARDGASGIASLRRAAPDIVLIDMNLPDTNGLALIERLRAAPETAGLHCIALSADAMPEQMRAAREAGFDDYWTKPIDVTRMLESVRQAIEGRRGSPRRAGAAASAPA